MKAGDEGGEGKGDDGIRGKGTGGDVCSNTTASLETSPINLALSSALFDWCAIALIILLVSFQNNETHLFLLKSLFLSFCF